MISELFYDIMHREIFGAALDKLGPMPRRLMRKAVVSAIAASVTAMWAGLMAGLAPLRGPLESVAEKLLGPLFEKEAELKAKLAEKLGEAVEKGLDKVEATLQEKFAGAFPVIAAAGEAEINLVRSSLTEWAAEVAAAEGKRNVLGAWWKYNWTQWRANWMYSHKSKPISEMIDVKLNDSDSTWESRRLAWHLKADFMQLNQSAFTVIKLKLLAEAPAADEGQYVALARAAYQDVSVRMAHDVQEILFSRVLECLDSTVRPPLEEVLSKIVEALCEPLQALIPEPLKDILDPARACDEIIDQLLREKLLSLLKRAMQPTLDGLKQRGNNIAVQGF
jgi:hypothetical protein